jgi:hypothetical protein
MRRPWIEPETASVPTRGSYPPDIARRRRQLGLPVTPEEHAAYARGEMREPPVTVAQMAATLRTVLPQCAPVFAQALRAIAAQCAQRAPGRRVVPLREPGDDDDQED